jgi:hypothetical protein
MLPHYLFSASTIRDDMSIFGQAQAADGTKSRYWRLRAVKPLMRENVRRIRRNLDGSFP